MAISSDSFIQTPPFIATSLDFWIWGIFGGEKCCLSHIVLEHIQLIQGFLTGTGVPPGLHKGTLSLIIASLVQKEFQAICFATELHHPLGYQPGEMCE